jgi:hypothetical protein
MNIELAVGDKFIHTDILGKKWELTYTGTRREVKGCEFEFFVDDKGVGCFFTDSEVAKMEKITPQMKTYKVPVVWQMYGYVEMPANSIDEAVKKVENGYGDVPLPADADYVEGSFEIDYEAVDFSAN